MVGYDKYNLAHQLELDLTFEEMTGTLAYCRAQSGIVCTLHGPPGWQQFINGLQRLEFDETNPDWLDAPGADTTGLNFTASDFSAGVWLRMDSLAANNSLFCRGLLDTDGWHCQVLINGSIILFTNQGGANQSSISAAGDIVIATWYLVGFSRDGASVRCYINGRDVTETEGTHVNPLTSARELHIGIYDNETGSPFAGAMHRPRAWSRALSRQDWLQLYNKERAMFP